MPATEAKSKQKRTLRPKPCQDCKRKSLQALDLACKLERAEFECDVMVDAMAKALERTNARIEHLDLMSYIDRIELARKASVINAYKKAWSKGQGEPIVAMP